MTELERPIDWDLLREADPDTGSDAMGRREAVRRQVSDVLAAAVELLDSTTDADRRDGCCSPDESAAAR